MDPGFRLDGRYRLERRLARRGPAQVWAARDELLARRVAVTLVGVRRSGRDLRRRLRDAARAAAALAHPNIVTTYDYGEAEGSGGDALAYAVTEYLGGESLAERLTRGLPGAQEAVGVCAQLADALAAVHACGTVHGDLRPAQVFLTADGVKLLGLGLTGALTEEAAEAADASGRAGDVLAFGRILAECLTGDPEAASPSGDAGDAQADLVDLAVRCRADDPAERPDAIVIARILAAQATETSFLPVVAEPGPPAAGRGGSRWRGLGRAGRGAVLGVAAAAMLALVLTPLAVITSSLSDAPRGVALPPLPSRSGAAPPPGSAGDPGGRPTAPSAPATLPGKAVPSAETRAVTVGALARMRRAIDVGIAAGEVGARFGSDLAREVSTLLNQVDGGEPVDLGRRVERLRAAIADRAPDEVSPGRAAGLTALLEEVPVRS
ncbi:protein kinase [Actinomadura sp. KC06]|uniref:protein kinase domain-containing protein n=1 Tax=Actinomadura sp. KC06 TaxID=2530369 RepID=UPI00140539EA|nr:protein kinase [Actinomadura sp. KC06]